MKRAVVFILLLVLAIQAMGQNAKYVFIFLGDGMGLNTVAYTEYYKASVQGKLGTEAMNFSLFPVCNHMTTWCADGQITDSAAAATALATGVKTKRGQAGTGVDGQRLTSVLETLKAQGRKVAIVTNDPLNSATEAGYAAHQKSRKDFEAIYLDILNGGFDFLAGKGVSRSSAKDPDFNPWTEGKKAGYTLAGSIEECSRKAGEADRILLMPDSKHHIGKAIERQNSQKIEITLAECVGAAVDFMMKDGCRNGFVMMAENGEIDHTCHGNDAASCVQEVLELEKAVDVALDFYRKHPKETAIIVLSDHDTGAPGLKISGMAPANLQYQTSAIAKISGRYAKMYEESCPSWEQTMEFLAEYTGLWTKVKLDKKDSDHLKGVYERTIAKSVPGEVVDEYGYNHVMVIVSEAIAVLNRYSGINWGSYGHTAGYVPVYYMGPRPELFMGRLDNTDIAPKVLQLFSGK